MTIEQSLRNIICDKLGVEPQQVTGEADLINDLDASSLDLYELTFEIEQEFQFEIDCEAAEKVHTFQQLVDLITNLAAINDWGNYNSGGTPGNPIELPELELPYLEKWILFLFQILHTQTRIFTQGDRAQ